MPCKVICTECGGRGYRLFMKGGFVDDLEKVPCRNCDGKGQIEELTWQERRRIDAMEKVKGEGNE